MRRLKNLLEKTEGGGMILTLGMLLLMLSMGLFAYDYSQIYTVAQAVEDHLESSVQRTVTLNYDQTFDGFKTGAQVAATYNENSGNFDFIVDYGDIYEILQQDLGLTNVGGNRYCKDEAYCISNLNVEVISAPSYTDRTTKFQSHVTIDLTLYWSNYGNLIVPFTFPIRCEANFTPKF